MTLVFSKSSTEFNFLAYKNNSIFERICFLVLGALNKEFQPINHERMGADVVFSVSPLFDLEKNIRVLKNKIKN